MTEYEERVASRLRKESKRNRWMRFEHELRYLFTELDTEPSMDDLYYAEDVRQTIIVYSMKNQYEENIPIYMGNTKREFYTAIKHLEENHPDIKGKTFVIKLFMEDFYFSK